ncbi:MAG TPA: hypothetical protein VH392_08595 [Sphingomicrobium sp.]
MATLVVIIHEFDHFLMRESAEGPITSPYLLFDVLRHLETLGHRFRISKGLEAENGDAALLHVDATIVDQEYLDLGKRYPLALNFRTGDISKRRISRILLSKDDPWAGPVIVKANYNNRAVIEDLHNRRAARAGKPAPHAGVSVGQTYAVLESLADVPDEDWSNPSLVVERFIAEQDEDGNFALRTWVFMGTRERCTRFLTTDRISKAADVISYESVEVPPQLRPERERLGFDFGKFDFVMQGGEPVLLDANRTPGTARAIRDLMDKGAINLAEGLHGLLTGQSDPVSIS